VDPLVSAEHTLGTTALEQIPTTNWPNVLFTSFAFTYILGTPRRGYFALSHPPGASGAATPASRFKMNIFYVKILFPSLKFLIIKKNKDKINKCYF
jgi:hypothetical protein